MDELSATAGIAEAMHQLEDFLLPRIEQAQHGDFSLLDFDGLIAEAKAERANLDG